MEAVIEKKDITNVYDLSPLQEGMLFHHLNEENDPYIVQIYLTLKGEVNTDLFQKSVNSLIAKHDAFRTSFAFQKTKRNLQIVLRKRDVEFEFIDISTDKVDADKFISDQKRKQREKKFNLSKDTLIRFLLIRYKSDKYELIITNHHIVMDGWCLGILFNDLFQSYQSLITNKPIQFGNKRPYSEYIKWLQKQDKTEALGFWKNQFDGFDNKTTIPFVKEVADNAYQFQEHELRFGTKLSEDILDSCKQAGVTINTYLQAIWSVLLFRFNNSNDIVFGNVISGRPTDLKGNEEIIGLFINSVPFRVNTNQKKTFTELLKQIHSEFIKVQKNGYVPLNEIENNDILNRGAINHLFVFENYPIDNNVKSLLGSNGIGFDVHKVSGYDRSNYNFNLVAYYDSEIAIKLKYNSLSITEEEVLQIADFISTIAENTIKNLQAPISSFEIISKKEKELILDYTKIDSWNNSQYPYDKDKTVVEAFKQVVKMQEDKTAVVSEGEEVSYNNLDKLSDALAFELTLHKIATNDTVAVSLEKSAELPISLLAILKNNATYLPIDKNYPKERVKYILEDSGAKILITTKNIFKNNFTEGEIKNCSVIFIEDIDLKSNKEESFSYSKNKDSIAYIIYTSGSTGKPKGTVIGQQGILNLQTYFKNYFGINKQDRIIQFASISFDASLWEMFMSLLTGAELHMLTQDVVENLNTFKEYCQNNKITTATLPPAYLKNLNPSDFKDLRLLVTAGSSTTPELVKKWNSETLTYYNAYGPTETTVCATVFNCKELSEDSVAVPIGKPIYNQQAFVLDKYDNLCPAGIPGELCVSGDNLAKQYLNRPELTKEKFREHPYNKGNKIYCTGDLVQWLPDGNIDFLGRLDTQIKIRGQRVETGEIENCIEQHENINDVFVTDFKDPDNDVFLCAYIVCKEEKELQDNDLREFMKDTLPDYMIPRSFVYIKEMPLNINGKVDKKELPAPLVNKTEYIAPGTEMEERLANIWKQVIGMEKVGVKDEFFNIGGDSIKAIRIVSQLQQQKFELQIRDIIQLSTIQKIAKAVKPISQENKNEIVSGNVKLSAIQKWFFKTYKGNINHFNMSVLMSSDNKVDDEAYQKAFESVIMHHDILRAQFTVADSGVNQEISSENTTFKVEVVSLDNQGDFYDKAEEYANNVQASLSLEQGQLIKSILFHTHAKDYIFIAVHHLVMDVISWNILLEDINTAYQATIGNSKITFPIKTTSFQKWIEQIDALKDHPDILTQIDYWSFVESKIQQSKKADYKTGTNKFQDADTLTLTISKEQTHVLTSKTNTTYGASLLESLTTILLKALYLWSGKKEHTLMIEGHGRENIDEKINVSRTIGWFTSIYPLFLELNKEDDFGQTIFNVKKTLKSIPQNGLGYGILKYLRKDLKLERESKPQISFNYHGKSDWESFSGNAFNVVPRSLGDNEPIDSERLHEIDINSNISNEELVFHITYNKKQFKESTINDLEVCLNKSLEEFVRTCEVEGRNKSNQQVSFEAVDSYVKETFTKYNIPGGILGIQFDENNKHIVPLGVSNPNTKTPMNVNGQFRTGSITKTYISTLILQLADKGLIGLDDLVSKYHQHPKIQKYGEYFTIRKLLNHTSGIRDFTRNEKFYDIFIQNPLKEWTKDEIIDYSFELGEDFYKDNKINYINSSTNFLILGDIAEIVTGEKLNILLEEYIFKPVGLKRTLMPSEVYIPSEFTHGWRDMENGSFTEGLQAIHPSSFWASGDIISSVEDSLKWIQVLIKGSLLSKKMQKERMNLLDISEFFPKGSNIHIGLGLFSLNGAIGQQATFANDFEFLVYNKKGVDIALYINRGRVEPEPYLMANEMFDNIINILT